MFGCVTYRLDGYDAHPAELFTIPDVSSVCFGNGTSCLRTGSISQHSTATI